MTKVTAIALMLLTVLGASSSSRSGEVVQSDVHVSPTAALFEESYAASKDLSELDQLQYLGDLVTISRGLVPDSDMLKWTDQLISRSSKNSQLTFRGQIANQKIGIVVLSYIDPVLAMQRFEQIGPAVADPKTRIGEDTRAFGARVLFLNYFRALGLNSLPKLREQAIKLQTTNGAYAFHAMSLIISDLGTSNVAEAEAVFNEALNYYPCGSNVRNQDSEFLILLHNAKPVVSQVLLKRGIDQFVAHLTEPSCIQNSDNDRYVAFIHTSNGTVRVTSQNTTLLFRAFPLIREIDPNLAGTLPKKIAELQNADAPVDSIIATFVPVDGSPADQQTLEAKGLQDSVAREIQNMRQSNPLAALQMANETEDQDNHIYNVAAVLPALAQRNPSKGKDLYARQMTDFESLQDKSLKPEATVWMAEAAYQVSDSANFQYLFNKAFDDGIAQFEVADRAKKTVAIENRAEYKALAELVQFAAAHNISWPLEEVRHLANTRLKVHLLMYAAKGLSERRP